MKIKPLINFAITGMIVVSILFIAVSAAPCPQEAVSLPILMYHHLAEIPANDVAISVSLFNEQMAYIIHAGYHSVSFAEVIDFVYNGTPLPQKPIGIVFDDGYSSNYRYAFPIMRDYTLKSTICMIGVHVGKSTYKDTGIQILPHLN